MLCCHCRPTFQAPASVCACVMHAVPSKATINLRWREPLGQGKQPSTTHGIVRPVEDMGFVVWGVISDDEEEAVCTSAESFWCIVSCADLKQV